MGELWDNPIRTDGFEFVEYAAPDPAALGALFEQMGFTAVAHHRSKRVTLYRQNDVNFVLNYYRRSPDHRLLFGGGESYGYGFPADIASVTHISTCDRKTNLLTWPSAACAAFMPSGSLVGSRRVSTGAPGETASPGSRCRTVTTPENGAVIKPSAATETLMKHRGRAVVFEDIEDYKAKMTTLMSSVRHHVEEEEKEVFPLAEKSLGDKLDEMGRQIEGRKKEVRKAA